MVKFAGVSHTLPVSVLLGTDVPQWGCLLAAGKQAKEEHKPKEVCESGEALLVTTLARALRQAEEAVLQEQREQASGVQSTALRESQVVPWAGDGVTVTGDPL